MILTEIVRLGQDGTGKSGGAAYRLSPADEIHVRRRHPGGDPGLNLDLGQRRGRELAAVRALRWLPVPGTFVCRCGGGSGLGATGVGESGEIDLERDARFLDGESCLRTERGYDLGLGGLVKAAPRGDRLVVSSARHRRGQQVADARRGPARSHASPPCMNSRRHTVRNTRSTQPEMPDPAVGPRWSATPSPQTTPTTAPFLAGGLRRRWSAPRRGRPPRGRPAGIPGNPPEPGTSAALPCGVGPGESRATMRSAVLTVALSRVVVYMNLQPYNSMMKAWS